MHDTLLRLRKSDFPALRRGGMKTLQAHLGYRCNLTILAFNSRPAILSHLQ
jgi:hypothetical protein